LINVLAREACFGKSSGRVLLNGETLTGRMIKQHAYVMKEQDKHWSYLTCRETLLYATQLYAAARTGKVEGLVDEIIRKTGLGSCADTACSRLNAVQCRCLSIGIALIKQPTLLFLDDPTLGKSIQISAEIDLNPCLCPETT
jgi:ABC-type multidrug transport system ATPase subunit